VPVTVGLVAGPAEGPPPAATAVARDELGGVIGGGRLGNNMGSAGVIFGGSDLGRERS